MISDIYTAVANLDVDSITVRNIDQIKLIIRGGDLPLRLLLPSAKGEAGFVAIGANGLTHIMWFIRDLCLWQPVVEGSGIEQCASAMLDYIEAYVTAFKTFRAPTAQSHLVSASFAMGPIPWAANDYWGVDVILEVEEFI